MTAYTLLYTAFLGLIVAGLFAFGVFYVFSSLYKVQLVSEQADEEINLITAERLVDACFRQGKDWIDEAFLEENKGKELKEICPDAWGYAWVQDLVAGKEWVFDKKGEEERGVFTNIKTGSEIHPAKVWLGYE